MICEAVEVERRAEQWRKEDEKLREKVHRLQIQISGLLALIIVWAVCTMWLFDRVLTEVARASG